jgi:hypothetical protein
LPWRRCVRLVLPWRPASASVVAVGNLVRCAPTIGWRTLKMPVSRRADIARRKSAMSSVGLVTGRWARRKLLCPCQELAVSCLPLLGLRQPS